MAKAQETFTAEELKVFSSLSPSELVGHRLHKLVQVLHLCKFIPSPLSFFFFLGVGGEPPPYFGVSDSGGQGRVCGVPGDDLRGGELRVRLVH